MFICLNLIAILLLLRLYFLKLYVFIMSCDFSSKTTWATTWQNQQNECAPSEDSISLGIRPVWSESSLCTQWEAKDPRFLHADSEDSDQTGRIPRLIWVFAGRTLTLLAHLSRRLTRWAYRMGLEPASVRVCVRPCVHTFKHEYLRDQQADYNQILSEASLGWGKGCIRFWCRSDQNSAFHGNG